MAKGPESRLQKKIQDRILKEYPHTFIFKSHGGPYQRSGLPDLMFVIDGYFFGVEVKLPGKENTLTKLQQFTIEEIRKANGTAFMSTDPDHTIEEIQAALELRSSHVDQGL